MSPWKTGEIHIKVGKQGLWDDGDIISALSRLRIRYIQSESIAHPWKDVVNKDGYLNFNSVSEHFCKNIYQYQFKRIASDTILRTDLVTGAQEEFSDTPNQDGKHIMVKEFLSRRKKHRARNGSPKKPIFGSDGKEIWYGGRTKINHSVCDSIWTKIAEKKGVLESEERFRKGPIGLESKRTGIVISVGDFSEEEKNFLVSSMLYSEEKNIYKRGNYIDWQKLPEISSQMKSLILDGEVSTDLRDYYTYNIYDIIKTKVMKDG